MSPYCCSSDDEHDHRHRDLMDEMPAFSTQSLSPSGRSLSPIDLEPSYSYDESMHCESSAYNTPFESPSQWPTGKDFVSIEEINARIGLTPPDSERSRSRLNLETIFEDKFLETPPKKEFESRTNSNLLRQSLRKRALFGTASAEPKSLDSLNKQFDNFKV